MRNDGEAYVVDGHHRLAAAMLAGLDRVAVRDVTGELLNGGFKGYADMADVLDSAASFIGNRLNPYKLRWHKEKMMVSVRGAVSLFAEARSRIEATFGKESSQAIVSAVMRGELPREGLVASGEEYFVHGIGYTVVLQNGGQVHLDSWRGGDVLSVYDIQLFFTTSHADDAPSIDDITKACEDLCLEGLLVKAEGRKYLLPR